jgi:hypothetical protein
MVDWPHWAAEAGLRSLRQWPHAEVPAASNVFTVIVVATSITSQGKAERVDVQLPARLRILITATPAMNSTFILRSLDGGA